MAASCPATLQYLSATCGKKLKSSKNAISLDLGGGRKLSGVMTIAKYLQRTLEEFKGLTLEDRMAVEQWLEYRLNIENASDVESEKLVLKELNIYLQDKVYFVAHQQTVADILLYHSLHGVFKKLTFQEKEKFINVSRWFDNVQQDQRARQSLPPLVFLRTPVYDGVSSHSH